MNPPDRILLRGALLCDGSAPPAPGALLLEDGLIAEVFAEPTPPALEGATLLDLPPNSLVVPGLIDAHTHLLSGGDMGAYDRELLKDGIPLRTLRAAQHARRALDFGFLTLRDVCTEGAGYADVALRDAIRAKICEGPRILPSGPGIGVTGGYMPSGFAPGICIPMGCSMVDGPDAARREVRLQVSHGVEWIKVFADWPVLDPRTGERPAMPTFTRPELEAITDEARRRGRSVAAHVTSDAGARQAIECRVASIEHMGELTAETLELAAKADITLVPTLAVVKYGLDNAPEHRREARLRMWDGIVAAFGRALASGVRIVCGTDIGCYPHDLGSLCEIRHMIDLGMRPLAALAAATSEAAQLLGLAQIGRIAQGKIADLAVFGFPDDTRDLTQALSSPPTLVLQGGQIVRDRR